MHTGACSSLSVDQADPVVHLLPNEAQAVLLKMFPLLTLPLVQAKGKHYSLGQQALGYLP